MIRFFSLSIFLLSLTQALTAETRVFIEAGNSLVVTDEVRVPPEKSYDTIVVLHGRLILEGSTDKLVIVSGSAQLKPGSIIKKEVVLIQGDIQQEPGAQMPEHITRVNWAGDVGKKIWTSINEWIKDFPHSSFVKFFTIPLAALVGVAFAIVILFAAVVLFFMAPGFSHRADRLLRDSLPLSILFGFLTYILALPILVLMILSIIGILVVPFYVMFILLVAFAGLIAGCRGLGAWVLRSPERYLVATFLGTLVAIALLFVPVIGQFLVALVWMSGTGALIRSFFVRQNSDSLYGSASEI